MWKKTVAIGMKPSGTSCDTWMKEHTLPAVVHFGLGAGNVDIFAVVERLGEVIRQRAILGGVAGIAFLGTGRGRVVADAVLIGGGLHGGAWGGPDGGEAFQAGFAGVSEHAPVVDGAKKGPGGRPDVQYQICAREFGWE